MTRTLLLALLALSLIIELALAGGAFFARAFTLRQFGVTPTPDTAFLGYIVAWTLLFVSLTCGLALYQLWQRNPDYALLCYLLGFWWMGIGIGIYLAFGKPDNLLLDSLKGLLIVILTSRSQVRMSR
ncbi:hypothetical protein [Spirosoma utsteinense]|uniref:Uncharacterized protein n=1 Tax=Spirosoma utsteinense TaxID=2585773 RepID=A0ABR6WEL3_9BACT|nr:hypothetical protein [Spirosoma utsteinense]MBC3788781.1 hypothetical protein [Spirosoma utsteinense]MBC3794734.1 hypothetical protein [Spirosoma utsteinense]